MYTHRRRFPWGTLAAACVMLAMPGARASEGTTLAIENEVFRVECAPANGAITGVTVKELASDLIGEQRLAANFRIGLPLPDCQCHYIEGEKQKPQSITQDGTLLVQVVNRKGQGNAVISLIEWREPAPPAG